MIAYFFNKTMIIYLREGGMSKSYLIHKFKLSHVVILFRKKLHILAFNARLKTKKSYLL